MLSASTEAMHDLDALVAAATGTCIKSNNLYNLWHFIDSVLHLGRIPVSERMYSANLLHTLMNVQLTLIDFQRPPA